MYSSAAVRFLGWAARPPYYETEAPPNMLEMGFRSYIDVSVKEQDYRAAVKAKGKA